MGELKKAIDIMKILDEIKAKREAMDKVKKAYWRFFDDQIDQEDIDTVIEFRNRFDPPTLQAMEKVIRAAEFAIFPDMPKEALQYADISPLCGADILKLRLAYKNLESLCPEK